MDTAGYCGTGITALPSVYGLDGAATGCAGCCSGRMAGPHAVDRPQLLNRFLMSWGSGVRASVGKCGQGLLMLMGCEVFEHW